jgi:hypothetical protein
MLRIVERNICFLFFSFNSQNIVADASVMTVSILTLSPTFKQDFVHKDVNLKKNVMKI